MRGHHGSLASISAGGALGTLARWGVGEALPYGEGSLPWSTMVANVSGSLLLGLLAVLLTEVWPTRRYVRPFLGVGVLGGYTTFSTSMLDTRSLIAEDRPVAAGLALFGTVLVALLAVWVGIVIGRAAIAVVRR